MKKFSILIPLFLLFFFLLFLSRVLQIWPLHHGGTWGLGESPKDLWLVPLIFAYAFTAITGVILAITLFMKNQISGKFMVLWLLGDLILGFSGTIFLVIYSLSN